MPSQQMLDSDSDNFIDPMKKQFVWSEARRNNSQCVMSSGSRNKRDNQGSEKDNSKLDKKKKNKYQWSITKEDYHVKEPIRPHLKWL